MKILLKDYSIGFILLGLVIFFSLLTIEEQTIRGSDAGEELGSVVTDRLGETGKVLLVISESLEDQDLKDAFTGFISTKINIEIANEGPPSTRKLLEASIQNRNPPDLIVVSHRASRWILFQDLDTILPELDPTKVVRLTSSRGSNFLKRDNLLNVADQIAVIAIIAIGMTMVIITGGIDLSVGSLVALSAVLMTQLVASSLGGQSADTGDLIFAGLIAVLACGGIGLLSGVLTTHFNIPSFIVTLSMMLIASGLAFTVSKGLSIYQLPDNFIWLGRGTALGIPVSVLIMVVLYFLANIVMSRMVFGRYVYAIGGNKEASRLSGVPIKKVVITVFTISGILGGIGGVILASQLNSGSPTYGITYELYVIAAVVIGGTSLMGGEGKLWGTLIGAFIIGVIQNGMNLVGIESYTQKVILGLLILVALLVEQIRKDRVQSSG